MDRERERDAAEALIEEHDEKAGGHEPERSRPGQGEPGSRPVDGQKPPEGERRSDEDDSPPEEPGKEPSPFAPR